MTTKHRESHATARRPFLRTGKFAAALVAASLALAASPAGANTTNPTSIKAVSKANANGSVTVTVSGGWTWPGGQACTGRYGTSWVVGWWGAGSAAGSFSVTNATTVVTTDQGINGNPTARQTLTPGGSIKIPSGYTSMGGQSIFASSQMNGQEIYTQAFCDVAQPSGKELSGTYTASATYPSFKEVPEKICVVTYDVHGSPKGPKGATIGGSTAGVKDFDPFGNDDNSVAKKQFTPETNCATVTRTEVPAGGVWGLIGITVLGGAGLLAFEMRRRNTSVRPVQTIS